MISLSISPVISPVYVLLSGFVQQVYLLVRFLPVTLPWA